MVMKTTQYFDYTRKRPDRAHIKKEWDMKVKYFSDTDTAHIEFTEKAVQETKEISENIHIDIDEKGNIVSMTIEHAKDNAGLWEFSYQEMFRQTA